MLTLQEEVDELRVYSGAIQGVRATDDPFIVKLMQLLFSHAVKVQASDIHVEPIRSGARVRYRIDGLLHEMLRGGEDVRDPLIRALKTQANLTTEAVGRSKPQDGRVNAEVAGKLLDLRFSSFPTLFGDVIAIRVLDRSAQRLKLEQMGFSAEVLQQFERLIRKPSGFLLVVGPTNSGKTTTLYAALERIQSPQVKVVTLEDPIEYQMEWVDQAQINPIAGLTFASGLRAILRQDANVILVGEIRDTETADIAVRAALTGHLVLSTLHARHACGAITRLLDMKIEPHLIASSLSGVLALRLVRLVCRGCQAPDPAVEPVYAKLLADATQQLPATGESGRAPAAPTFVRGQGCAACNGTGYHGRIGLFELLVMHEQMRSSLLERSSSGLFQAALAAGLRPILLDGLEKAARGLTTMSEVLRVIGESDEQ